MVVIFVAVGGDENEGFQEILAILYHQRNIRSKLDRGHKLEPVMTHTKIQKKRKESDESIKHTHHNQVDC